MPAGLQTDPAASHNLAPCHKAPRDMGIVVLEVVHTPHLPIIMIYIMHYILQIIYNLLVRRKRIGLACSKLHVVQVA